MRKRKAHEGPQRRVHPQNDINPKTSKITRALLHVCLVEHQAASGALIIGYQTAVDCNYAI